VTLAAATTTGSTPAGLLRALDLSVRRRVEGLLPGDHASTVLGPGTELAQVRAYQPGDDVRRIDWNVTARTNEPHVRAYVAERSLTTWLVLDTSASMAFGTADRAKATVAEGVAVAVGHLACRGANRLAVATFGGAAPVSLPPAQGRAGLLALLATVRESDPTRSYEIFDPSAAENLTRTEGETLGQALDRMGRRARQRGLVIIVGDLRGPDGPSEWHRPLQQLASRHDVVVVEIGDPREMELPAVGELTLVDPETGRHLRVDTSRRKIRERFAAAAAAERAQVAATVTAAGADHLVLSTAGDWLRPFATFLLRREHRR
jgi:uncharacterized protein (DUF58 family)